MDKDKLDIDGAVLVLKEQEIRHKKIAYFCKRFNDPLGEAEHSNVAEALKMALEALEKQ